jgi:PhnB protein
MFELLDDVISGAVRELPDPELAMLVVIASDLRGLPDPRFKQELKRRIVPMTTMTEVRKPAGFGTLTPYLVGTDVTRLHEFLRQAFDADVRASIPRPDGSIMHSEVAIGDSIIEIGEAEEKETRPCELHLYVPDADATYARAVAAGARSLSAPVDQPYGDREAGVVDPSGNVWYIATHGETVRPEGLRSVTPFLHARGAGSLIDFMKTAFEAQETSRYADPTGTILHAVVHLGDSALELGEAHGEYQPMPTGLHLFVDDVDSVYERALRAGGKSLFDPHDEPYGQRIGAVIDQDGNRWFIAAML